MKRIPLSQGKYATVDDGDFDSVSKFKWCLDRISGNEYAARKSNGKTVRMHQFILGHVDGFVIDHIDSNGLNNCRSNLRHASKSLNGFNRKKCKGYYYDKKKNRFFARLVFMGKAIRSKGLKSEDDARVLAISMKKTATIGSHDFYKAVKK